MKVQVELSPVVSNGELVQLARLVEESGVERLGISDVTMLRDSLFLQALCVEATRHVRIGSLISNPYVRHPGAVAAALATLNEISQGRAFLGIGVGAGLSNFGVDHSHSAHQLEEFLQVVRRLLSGEEMELDGPRYREWASERTDDASALVPIVVGARSRQVANLAGRMADAVVVGVRELTADALQRYRGWVHEGARLAGRDLDDLDIAPRVTVCISHDGELARRSVALYTAHHLAMGGLEESGLDPERFQLISRLAAQSTGWYFEPRVKYPLELDDLITVDLIERFAIAGTPQQCLGQVRRLAEMGCRSISMNVAWVRRPSGSTYHGLRETVEGLGEILTAVQRI